MEKKQIKVDAYNDGFHQALSDVGKDLLKELEKHRKNLSKKEHLRLHHPKGFRVDKNKMGELEINEDIEKYLNKYFPKGDRARGRALVLNAIANIKLRETKEEYLNRGIYLAIKILEERRKFLIKDKKGWNKKDKEVARAEISILEQLLAEELGNKIIIKI